MPENDEIGVLCGVDGCDERIVGLDDGFDLGRGTVCQDCIDYHDRHGHWPDESVEICPECRIDEGMIPHDCEESAADRVLLEPGNSCRYCEFEAPVTDGGSDVCRDDTDRQHDPVDVPADDAKNYRQIKKCEGCGAPGARAARGGVSLRAIKMRQGRRRMFCLGCFTHELERGTVDPSDPRVENHGFGGENYA